MVKYSSARVRVPTGPYGPTATHCAGPGWAGSCPCPPGRARAGRPTCYFEVRGAVAEALNVTRSRAGGAGQNLQN